MIVVRSRSGAAIRLTEERWAHIERGHPEMKEQRDKVLETMSDPDMIQEGDDGVLLAVRLYPTTPLTRKYLVAPYREIAPDDGFIVTAYLTRRPSVERRVIWKRSES